MVDEPIEPQVRHVWLRGHGDYGPPKPAVVVAWQPAPVRNATQAAWNALVMTIPFAGAMAVEWVSADRLVPVRDPEPRAARGDR